MVRDGLRKQAIKMRKNGCSYGMIHAKFGIPKGTLSYWLSDVRYKPNAQTLQRIQVARDKTNASRKNAKKESIENAKKTALMDIGIVSERDLFMLGLGLYIGEGTKSVNVAIINSDVRVIRFAVYWFTACFDLTVDNLKLAIYLYPDNNEKKCLDYWAKATGIPKKQFTKTQIDKRENKKMAKRGKLRYGTARLTVVSNGKKSFGSMAFLRRRIIAQMDEVLS